MWTCVECHKENTDDMTRCSQCGKEKNDNRTESQDQQQGNAEKPTGNRRQRLIVAALVIVPVVALLLFFLLRQTRHEDTEAPQAPQTPQTEAVKLPPLVQKVNMELNARAMPKAKKTLNAQVAYQFYLLLKDRAPDNAINFVQHAWRLTAKKSLPDEEKNRLGKIIAQAEKKMTEEEKKDFQALNGWLFKERKNLSKEEKIEIRKSVNKMVKKLDFLKRLETMAPDSQIELTVLRLSQFYLPEKEFMKTMALLLKSGNKKNVKAADIAELKSLLGKLKPLASTDEQEIISLLEKSLPNPQ